MASTSTHDENSPLPQDQNTSQMDQPSLRASQQSINSESLQSSVDGQSNITGESLHLSSLHSLNYEGTDEEHFGSESCEDDKAKMMMQLMQNHAHAVTTSLVERTLLIQSVIWLSHHVPRCVLDLLFEDILRDRNALEDRHDKDSLENSMENLCIEDKPSGDFNDETETTECSLYHDNNTKTHESLHPLNDLNENDESHPNPSCNEERLPISKNHNSALLFVDMSGFTKISTVLDVESLSNAINSYFQAIVDEVTKYGGDILKFAGDAIFAEWKESEQKPDRTIEYCVMQAAECAASIVKNCSDYPIHSKPIGKSRGSFRVQNTRHHSFRGPRSSFRSSLRSSIQSHSDRSLKGSIQSADECFPRQASMESGSSDDQQLNRRRSTDAGQVLRRSSAGLGLRPVTLATLNVKCSIGVGHIVGIHVGDDALRREYLILGDPIEQVAAAEEVATKGEVVASPQALKILSNFVTWRQSFDQTLTDDKPKCIAERQDRFYDIHEKFLGMRDTVLFDEPDNILHRCEDLHTSELRSLKRMLSLYVHEVVVNDENESQTQVSLRGSDIDKHLSQAELRNVFVAFISPMIDYKLTGDDKKDRQLFHLLNDIMKLTTRTLHKLGGHLRQFIIDDKGICLICTFGLRNSTFPNMISQRALPLTRSIYDALQELGIKSKIGATFGRAYCGVVGGISRHEFAVMGPSVNLAARLTGKSNPGIILVDKSIRLLTNSQIFFKPHPAVNAKGYDEPGE